MPKTIRELHLGDVDLGSRRLVIAGRGRPLDALTTSLLLDWLQHRGRRWPGTANPHLIINQQTAMTTRAVSENWLTGSCRGLTATLERLRVDRQLEEALTCGADPLHLAAVFAIDDTTAGVVLFGGGLQELAGDGRVLDGRVLIFTCWRLGFRQSSF